MGIYIKNMEMPKCCGECRFQLSMEIDSLRHPMHICVIGGFAIKPSELDLRDGLCPLIEVKAPHGRLIDADKQHKRLQKQVMALYSEKSDKYAYLMDVLYSIHGEPTVIEAEVE